MNLTHRYSSACGVKPKAPKIGTSYFPLKFDNYIVIDNRCFLNTGVYDLFQDVISYIRPALEREGITILSLCKDDKHLIEGTNPYIFLEKKQECYILRNSKLNICADNWANYASNAFEVPCIGIYSPYPAKHREPLNAPKHISLESPRNGNLPAYGLEESPKAINFLEPEKVANAIFQQLGLTDRVDHDTVWIGDYYPIKIMEVIPDFVPEPELFAKRALNIRMDYHFDEHILCEWLRDRYVNILTDRPINLELLNYFRYSIPQVTINLNDSFPDGYIESVKSIGFKVELFCENKDRLKDYRFKYFDFDVNETIWKNKENFDNNVTDNTRFISSKILLSGGKRYSCIEAKRQKIELTGEPEVVYDTADFWKELDHYRIIEER